MAKHMAVGVVAADKKMVDTAGMVEMAIDFAPKDLPAASARYTD
ncbi:hypothetical protein EMIT07CA2_70118 [Brevibacillus sp. IT-7CA2]